MTDGRAAVAPVLAFRDLTLGYDRHPAVHHLTGEILPGDLVALVGPNGAGKSTLLKGIAGELKPLGGRLDRGRIGRRDVAYLPQTAEIDRAFPIGVLDLARMGFWGRKGAWAGFRREDDEAAAEALDAVGLSGFEDRPIGTLSGGQMQRALFARVLLQNARLILLDEPFAGVDGRTTEDLIALIRRWHHEGRTVVAALHDLDQVRRHFPRTLLLARDAVAFGPTDQALSEAQMVLARRLSEAWDEDADLCRRGAHDAQKALSSGHRHPGGAA